MITYWITYRITQREPLTDGSGQCLWKDLDHFRGDQAFERANAVFESRVVQLGKDNVRLEQNITLVVAGPDS